MKVTVYSPKSGILSPRRTLKSLGSDLLASRELAWRLFLRNIRSKYRQAALGIGWAFLSPLATTLVWIFLSSSGVLQVQDTGLPYPLYVLTGTLLWQVFIQALDTPMRMLNSNKSLLGKINFPRESLILAGAGEVVFNFGISLIMISIAFIAFQFLPTWQVLLVPLGAFALLLFGLTIGLLLTPFGMMYKDVGSALKIITQFLFYVTPIAYTIPKSGIGKIVMEWNPLSYLMLTTRDWLTIGETTHLMPFLIVMGITIPLFLFSLVLYKLAMPYIIERVAG